MRIIDRYLLRQFVQVFIICFFSLTGIYVVFDAFTHLEAFLRCGKGVQLLKVIGVYYAVHSTFFFDQCSNLLVLMAAMFTVAWIQRHNEMTALMAAGVSRRRIVTPVLIAAAAIILLAAANREFVIPRFQEELAQQPSDLSTHSVQAVLPQRDNLTDVLISGRTAVPAERRIESPDFLVPAGLADYGKHWSAVNAYYQPPAAGRPGGYLLDNVLKPKNLPQKPSLLWEGKPVLITPRDRPDWLTPGQAFVTSDVTFDLLTEDGKTLRAFASTAELIHTLRNRSCDFGADVRVTIHSRIVQPLLDLTLLFLGLPLIVTRERRNVFMAIGLCMGVVAALMLLEMGCWELGRSCLIGPALAAWVPLMIFVPAAAGISRPMWQS
ncbi:MAG: LptF/LptG family permease [Thermoguttaceae bacterium]|jgi:lipopolysaccharide export system permease protein